MKIVINNCAGQFGLSRAALYRLRELKNHYAIEEVDIGETWTGSKKLRIDYFDNFLQDIPRHDKQLVQVVEELGKDSWGPRATLEIVEGPEEYGLRDTDGKETVISREEYEDLAYQHDLSML